MLDRGRFARYEMVPATSSSQKYHFLPIEPLLDPRYRTSPGFEGDGTQGTHRFL